MLNVVFSKVKSHAELYIARIVITISVCMLPSRCISDSVMAYA